MTTFADPRARMRDALRLLMQSDPPAWDDASLARFRNRLLDETGSDARPLAELLIEAIRRGWRERLPGQPIGAAHWDALSSPFVMRWSAERFVQPEMARWAAESWGYALGIIQAEQLRIAAPLPPAPPATARPVTTRSPNGGFASGGPATRASAGVASRTPANLLAQRIAAAPPAPSASSQRGRPRVGSRTVAPTYRPSPMPLRQQPWAPSKRLAYSIAGLAAASYVFFIGRMMVAVSQSRSDTVQGADAVADSARRTGPAVVSAGAPGASAESAVSRTALAATRSDSTRMLFVEPARRATGASMPSSATALAPPRTLAIAFDQLQLVDGTRMTGRVDIIRSGTVVFRDMRTGLRHEVRKDDVEQIITEFGTPVRFRSAASKQGARAGIAGSVADRLRGGAALAPDVAGGVDAGVRATGVGGRYRIQYAAAKTVGSPACASVWTRAPQSFDVAMVRHAPNADTLTLALVGGDDYPSNVDAEGFFASTPRVMPDQARTSTALITRLNGHFTSRGTLSLTVSIVFFRRMRVGADVACTVSIDAVGSRDP